MMSYPIISRLYIAKPIINCYKIIRTPILTPKSKYKVRRFFFRGSHGERVDDLPIPECQEMFLANGSSLLDDW